MTQRQKQRTVARILKLVAEYGNRKMMSGWSAATADSFEGDDLQFKCRNDEKRYENSAALRLKKICVELAALTREE